MHPPHQDNGPQVTRTQVPYQPPEQNQLLPWRPHFPPPDNVASATTQSNVLVKYVVAVLLVGGVVLGVVFWNELTACLDLVGEIGSTNPQSQIKGFAVLGVILVALVAVVRILRNNQHDGGSQ